MLRAAGARSGEEEGRWTPAAAAAATAVTGAAPRRGSGTSPLLLFQCWERAANELRSKVSERL